ncbi:hypothetical protein KJ359_001742 [Pestalotiopsis sp. 9143b]|nr:hypothetical protein KJ359_001742 [Pestalotiopsis sp. 9143b]
MADIRDLTDKFFNAHQAPWIPRDTAAFTIMTTHWNLCMGTMDALAGDREDIQSLLKELKSFQLVGEFMLAEVGHGLDAVCIETTSTLQSDGSFIMHTPSRAAAKSMPKTAPWISLPRVAVVMARLIVSGSDHGIRAFVVHLTDSDGMKPGITSKVLPYRSGSKPVDHAITSFKHVKLSPTALLGALEIHGDAREIFYRQIRRVHVGTLALSLSNIIALQSSAYTAWRYSLRRRIAVPGNTADRAAIYSFPTQRRPIISAAAHSIIFKAYAAETVRQFRDESVEWKVRYGLATIFKAYVSCYTQGALGELADRCGWQGLFGYNQIIENLLALKGNMIAEGDVLVLSIPQHSESLLAMHERDLWKEASQARSFDLQVMPRCRDIIIAIGQRMAYEAAKSSTKVSSDVLAVFEAQSVMCDPAWYVGHNHASFAELQQRESEAFEKVKPQVENIMLHCESAAWASAPIIGQDLWEEFENDLTTFDSQGRVADMKLGSPIMLAATDA